ncbi:hypothetical protein D9613_012056 [Agrocybe pediades]|uniref:Nephrocystin 3-like N-terminal domain-containing protein n=1 Tax=Agrocybe pediades TaxID=84607 RepID=A0A8H4QF32_9AGAR|nr:hypothetical protein D9613_012056 [Agrocybe pediades]
MPPMISGNIVIHNGQFTQVNNPSNTSSTSTPVEKLARAAAPNAFHNSKERFDAPKCHPNTRVAVLDHIEDWAHGRSGETSSKSIMWLHGPAGCGKSAIAQTTVERCLEKGVKLAAFFFNRFDPSRNHSRQLIGTLAYQVYTAFPETDVQRLMLSAIEDDPLIFERTIHHQFHALIAHPLYVYLSSLHSERPSPPGILIVIDGLDECVERRSQQEILEVLSDSEYAKMIPILIASRPEAEITSSFDSMNMKDTHTRLALDYEYQTRADIKLYLHDSFEKIKSNHPFRRYLSSSWPDDKLLATLLDKSSGQFIYAASVVKYVGSIRHRPDHRLEAALHLRPHNGDLPFAQLDSLYTMILQSALDVEKVCRILSFHFIAKYGPVPCSTIERILSYDEGEIDILFCDLQAVVEIRPSPTRSENRLLHVVHASFEDYLIDPERSKQFHVDIEQERPKNLVSIMQYLSSYGPRPNDGNTAILILFGAFLAHSVVSCELKQAAFSFRMQHFMQYWAPHNNVSQFVRPFFRLLKRLTVENSSDSHIEKHQLKLFISFLFEHLERFYADDGLALSLMLILFHLGSHRYIPMIIRHHLPSYSILQTYTVYSCPANLVSPRVNGKIPSNGVMRKDPILDVLYHLYLFDEPSHFLGHLRTFLLDPERPGEYVIGPDTYAKAALGCFKKICSLHHPEAHVWHDMLLELGEDDHFETWRFDSGHWMFNISPQSNGSFGPSELYFIVLGYLIFFLPRCGRLDALIAECLRSKVSFPVPRTIYGGFRFPIRRWHLYCEIEAYLARFNSA